MIFLISCPPQNGPFISYHFDDNGKEIKAFQNEPLQCNTSAKVAIKPVWYTRYDDVIMPQVTDEMLINELRKIYKVDFKNWLRDRQIADLVLVDEDESQEFYKI